MTTRLSCTSCGELIHPDTAAKNAGLCMPCKGGYRNSIEAGKKQREEERKYKNSPPRLFWLALLGRVHAPGGSYAVMSKDEQTYYAVRSLVGEVLNGGFHQFFSNHSGELYALALDGLLELEANNTYRCVAQAKELLFGASSVPVDFATRNKLLPDIASLDIKDKRGLLLDSLEMEFYKDTDCLDSRLTLFATTRGLYASDD